MTHQEFFDNLPDPDDLCSAEYRAIYDVLASVVEDAEELDELVAVLEEFLVWAFNLLKEAQ